MQISQIPLHGAQVIQLIKILFSLFAFQKSHVRLIAFNIKLELSVRDLLAGILSFHIVKIFLLFKKTMKMKIMQKLNTARELLYFLFIHYNSDFERFFYFKFCYYSDNNISSHQLSYLFLCFTHIFTSLHCEKFFSKIYHNLYSQTKNDKINHTAIESYRKRRSNRI